MWSPVPRAVRLSLVCAWWPGFSCRACVRNRPPVGCLHVSRPRAPTQTNKTTKPFDDLSALSTRRCAPIAARSSCSCAFSRALNRRAASEPPDSRPSAHRLHLYHFTVHLLSLIDGASPPLALLVVLSRSEPASQAKASATQGRQQQQLRPWALGLMGSPGGARTPSSGSGGSPRHAGNGGAHLANLTSLVLAVALLCSLAYIFQRQHADMDAYLEPAAAPGSSRPTRYRRAPLPAGGAATRPDPLLNRQCSSSRLRNCARDAAGATSGRWPWRPATSSSFWPGCWRPASWAAAQPGAAHHLAPRLCEPASAFIQAACGSAAVPRPADLRPLLGAWPP